MAAPPLGVYVPGTSAVHRARAGAKLAVLCIAMALIVALRSPVVVGTAGLLVVGIAAWARIPARVLTRQVRPVIAFAVIVGALQIWTSGWVEGVVVAGSLVVAVAAAAVVTLTTRTQDLLDALVTAVRPLRLVGVDPERVALTLALTVRSVTVVAQLARDVHEARMARGAERSARALAVPLVIRTVRYADRLGEALAARGIDDDPEPPGHHDPGDPGPDRGHAHR